VVEKMGMRAVLGCSYFDATIDKTLASAERAAKAAEGKDRIRISVAPHAPYTVSEENLVRGKRFAEEHGLDYMVHAAETQDELRYVAEKYQTTPVRLLDKLGLLDSRTVLAHCVWVDREEMALMRERGVTVAHNAQSNMKISSGVAPVAEQLEEGVCVTLATDGSSSNNDLDLWEEMRSAAFLQKLSTEDALVLPAWEVLRMATANGARAMGYADGELGVIREGALADLIVIDLNKPHLQPIHDVVSNLVYCGKASDVESVMVDGRMVVEERRIKGIDLPALYAQMAEAVTRIKQAIAAKR
jgi:5-methylthioadenosine/S-adenosylhomocysteine deaminase